MVALLWRLNLVVAVPLKTAMQETMIAAVTPRIVTTVSNSINENADRRLVILRRFTA
jgi:hypothetical protein